MDVSALRSRELREYERYLDSTERDYIDYYPESLLSFPAWKQRENPCDPDLDA